jgi:hypothetical protein
MKLSNYNTKTKHKDSKHTEVVGVVAMFNIHNLELSVSNFNQDNGAPHIFHSFSQSRHANSGIVSSNKSRSTDRLFTKSSFLTIEDRLPTSFLQCK